MFSRSHSKAYLESLLQPPPPPSGTIGSRRSSLTRSISGLGLAAGATEANHYKPTRSSGLAVEGRDSSGNSTYSKITDDSDVDDLFSSVQAAISSAVSISSASEDDEDDPSKFLSIHSTPQRQSQPSTNGAQSVSFILNVLDDESLDDEERIDQVRTLLAARISEAEGIPVTATRLDNMVLSLLHRHREDIRPTGASFTLPISPSPSPFPASPRSRPRPANLRTMSSNTSSISRPWTPTTESSLMITAESGPSIPSSPLMIPQTLNFGNGSPRASPSLWHRSISNSTNITATTNPWSHSSPVSTSTSTFAPLGPPGDTIGSPPKSASAVSSNLKPLLSTPIAALSRPSSPGHGSTGSPRLNVGAIAFKPRSSTPKSSQTVSRNAAVTAPWIDSDLEGVQSQTTSSDSDDDEFSPFVNQGVTGAVPVPGSSSSSSASSSHLAAEKARPISGASGNSSIQSMTTVESIGGSYHGSTTSASLESSDDPRSLKTWSQDEMGGADKMTPFDVLSSILSSSSTQSSSWSNEQIEEALERHNWDIDATLTAMMESGGLTGPATIFSRKSPNTLAMAAVSSNPTTLGRSGVSLVSSDSIVNQRVGIGNTPGAPSSSSLLSASSTLSSAQLQQQQQQQQQYQQQQQQQQGGGGVGPGRVCRYFLVGECKRADCRFSHDLNRAVCRFWMKGQCLNGDGCNFLHDTSIVDKLTNRLSSMSTSSTAPSSQQQQQQQQHPSVETKIDEFPELRMAPTGPKAQRTGKGGSSTLTPGSYRGRRVTRGM